MLSFRYVDVLCSSTATLWAAPDRQRGALSGTVTYQSGAVLRGAEISNTGSELKAIAAKTDDAGSFIVNLWSAKM